MKTRLIIGRLILVLAIFLALIKSETIFATGKCTIDPCCVDEASGYYLGCGPGCKCADELANQLGVCENIACPLCVPDDCPDGWSKGVCGAGESNCQDKCFECACGNEEICCKKKSGPPPTDGPTPTPAPPTSTPVPSPTPVQPTEIINQPLPSPQAFSNKATTSVFGNPNAQAQSWICLDTKPCSASGANCSGGDPQHRVRITTKSDAPLYANKKTYIFECLQTTGGLQCTTGNRNLDSDLTGLDPLPDLAGNYGYEYVEFTDAAGNPINQTDEAQVIVSNNEGKIGTYEWESKTTKQVGRMIMSMQSLMDGDNLEGGHGTQKLGTFNFKEESNEIVCIMIKWDPRGVVFDADTLTPVEGVKITLFRQDKTGAFAPVLSKDILGGIVNPALTGKDGYYAFYVPNGTYRLVVEKEGYRPLYSDISPSVKKAYQNIYDGGDIATYGRLETRNIALKKITFMDMALGFIRDTYGSLTFHP